MIDIEKIKQAALAALNGYTTGNFIAPEIVIELATRLEAAEKDAKRYQFIKQQTEYGSQSVIRTAYGRIMKLQIWHAENRQYSNCIGDLSAYIDVGIKEFE